MSQGVYHGGGLYAMGTRCSPLFVIRCCHTGSKWCKRRLKLNEKLQVYAIGDSVRKPLDGSTHVALMNVQGLMPLKMLYRGVEALCLVLPGRGVN
jgi:hypothetical protein